MKLNYFVIQRNNMVRLTEGPFQPDYDLSEIIPDPDQVTGFRFSYSKGEGNDEEYVKMVFIGEIVDCEQVKSLISQDAYEEYKDCKFAVSRYPDGTISDLRVIGKGIDEVIPVSDREELLKMYEEETGYKFMQGRSR